MTDNHIKKVSVRLCDNASCRGDEEGCNGSECRNARWRRYTHKQFVNWMDRCPRGCNVMKLSKADSKVFADALINPPAPNERLRKAANKLRKK